jgi:FKBP-type peptidyl-prolyl cis-trans isomerase FkpA
MITAAGIMLAGSCKKDDTAEKQAELDEQIIQDYLNENNIDAVQHESGLYYLITDEGTGENPDISSTIDFYYKGYFTDGSIFDQSTTGPAHYPLQNLITGWQIGIPLIKEGGSITLFIPSALGYGSNGSGSVPPNAVIIFDIDLIATN